MRSGVETNYSPSDRGGGFSWSHLFKKGSDQEKARETTARNEEVEKIRAAGGFDLLISHAAQLWTSGDEFAIVVQSTFTPPLQLFWDLEKKIILKPGTEEVDRVLASSKGIALKAPRSTLGRLIVLFTQEEKDAMPKWKRLEDIGFSESEKDKGELVEYRKSGLLETDILTLKNMQSTEVPLEEQIRIARLLAKRHPDIRGRYDKEVVYEAKFSASHR